jgi:hypothetical protein
VTVDGNNNGTMYGTSDDDISDGTNDGISNFINNVSLSNGMSEASEVDGTRDGISDTPDRDVEPEMVYRMAIR